MNEVKRSESTNECDIDSLVGAYTGVVAAASSTSNICFSAASYIVATLQVEWQSPSVLLSKLSGSWKTSSPVVSASTPTLNPNCCSASTCSANSVWSDLWSMIARDYPFSAPPAVDPPSSLQLVFQVSKLHFTSTTSLRSEMP